MLFFMMIEDMEFILKYFDFFGMMDYVFIVIDYFIGFIDRF